MGLSIYIKVHANVSINEYICKYIDVFVSIQGGQKSRLAYSCSYGKMYNTRINRNTRIYIVFHLLITVNLRFPTSVYINSHSYI